jgi:transglutaminase-like putative cysteine protease
MRIHGPLSHILFFVALTPPAFIHAQFQQPTAEELSMTADPKAPGADAVYLNVEEVTDDELHFHSFYARIKVLTEKGKALATVNIPYLQSIYNPMLGEFRVQEITDIKARSIHPDGTVIPFESKPGELVVSKNSDWQFNRKGFTVPGVEVGSIIEYRYQLRYDQKYYSSPLWEIQRPYFVHQAHYSFTPFKAFRPGIQNATSRYLIDSKGNKLDNLVWWAILPPGVEIKTDAIGRHTVDLTDIPPAPKEQWMPPIRSVLYKVLFYYSNRAGAGDYWVAEAKDWSKEVNQFAQPSTSIRDAVSGIVAPGDSDLDKAIKLYKAVQALDNTGFSRAKAKVELKQLGLRAAKRAEDTWSQKSGSGRDIALLYLAMLRAAGLTAYEMRIADRAQGDFAPAYLNFGQLDDDIVIVSIGGKEIVLDPAEKMCPFQAMHWRHSGATGIRQSPSGESISTSPYQTYAANTIVRTGDVTLDDHGAFTADLSFIMTGQEALRWRQIALRNDLGEVRKQFDNWLRSTAPEGADAHVDHFLGLDDPDVNLMAVIKAQGTLGAATSRRLLLPGFFFDTRGNRPFVGEEKRIEPVDMHYADQVTDQIVYHLPAGLTVEGAPQNAEIPWAGHAVLVDKSEAEPGKVTITRQLSRAFTIAKPEEYQQLRGFFQKVAAADQQQLVLTRASAAQGN